MANENSPRLNPTDVRLIKELLSKGCLQKEVAEDFNVSVRTIKRIAAGDSWGQVDGPSPKYTGHAKLEPTAIAEILKLYRDGVTGSEIARRLDVDKTTVYRYLRKRNIRRDL